MSWAAEVVVIDSSSTDRTAEIVAAHGARLVQVEFRKFGELRQAGIEHTTQPWIFSLDSDERCTPEARDEILRIVADPASADAYLVPRRNFLLGREIRHGGWYPDYRQPQLFRRGRMRYAVEDDVHEVPALGDVGQGAAPRVGAKRAVTATLDAIRARAPRSQPMTPFSRPRANIAGRCNGGAG